MAHSGSEKVPASPPKESPLGEVPLEEERSSDGDEMEVESGEEEGESSEDLEDRV